MIAECFLLFIVFHNKFYEFYFVLIWPSKFYSIVFGSANGAKNRTVLFVVMNSSLRLVTSKLRGVTNSSVVINFLGAVPMQGVI